MNMCSPLVPFNPTYIIQPITPLSFPMPSLSIALSLSFFRWSWIFTIYVYVHIIHLIFFDVLLESPIIDLVIPIVSLSPIHCQINFLQIHYSHNTLHYFCNVPIVHLVFAIIHLPSNCDLKENFILLDTLPPSFGAPLILRFTLN